MQGYECGHAVSVGLNDSALGEVQAGCGKHVVQIGAAADRFACLGCL